MKKMYAHLSKDRVLKSLIRLYPNVEKLTPTQNLFVDIVSNIVSQQLSTKAASTIWKRFEGLFPEGIVTPYAILQIPDDTIRAVGVSYPKIKYMKGLSELVHSGELQLEKLPQLTDEEVIAELVKVKGIGKWTAEMLLMFSLAREDVFSLGDLGLRNAVAKQYNIDRDNLEEIARISEKWSPYRTYAALYLWKSLDNAPATSS